MAQLRQLKAHFGEALVVIGIHSAKFPAEKVTENIRQAIMRHHIEHPVINDESFHIWQTYTIRAWPTVVLIDPAGKIVGYQPGELDAAQFTPIIEELITKAKELNNLDEQPLILKTEAEATPLQTLHYPAKLLVKDADHLFIADTGQHRILELKLNEEKTKATLMRTFGTGQAGFKDGAADEATFHDPHGLALSENIVYVADTDNHAIRAINLETNQVKTIAGTGQKGRGLLIPAVPTEMALRSPWALLAEPGFLLIAMAGTHQIWFLKDETELLPLAGNGREALVDGSLQEASFNQPSDLAFGMSHLLVADAEASAIRAISFGEAGQVITLVGQGLFEFGDIDGYGAEARLQHPIGLAYGHNLIYIADSYNHKIKTLNPTSGLVETLIGTGNAGYTNGAFNKTEFFEPEGLAIDEDYLYIADTNNHCIRVANLITKQTHTLQLA